MLGGGIRAMKGFRPDFGSLTIVLACMSLFCGCGGANNTVAPSKPPTSNAAPGNAFVYTANAGANSISGFSNDSTGALTPIAGSPFSSSGEPFGIAATPNSKFLYVSLFQSAAVNGFAIDPASGVLTPLNCGSTATTGSQPLKIAITPSGGFLYTANQTGSVSGFAIDATTGCLTAISTSPTDAVARGLTVDRNGKFLYVVTGGGGIDGFSIAADGTLTRLASGFDSGSGVMLAVKASPNADILIASDGATPDDFRVFTINTNTGAITVTADVGTNATPSAIAYNRNPSFADVYVADTGSNNLTHTAVTPQGEAFPFLETLPAPGSTGPIDLDTDPAGKFLYVAGNGSSNVTALLLQNPSPALIGNIATGSGPESIAVVPKP